MLKDNSKDEKESHGDKPESRSRKFMYNLTIVHYLINKKEAI